MLSTILMNQLYLNFVHMFYYVLKHCENLDCVTHPRMSHSIFIPYHYNTLTQFISTWLIRLYFLKSSTLAKSREKGVIL